MALSIAIFLTALGSAVALMLWVKFTHPYLGEETPFYYVIGAVCAGACLFQGVKLMTILLVHRGAAVWTHQGVLNTWMWSVPIREVSSVEINLRQAFLARRNMLDFSLRSGGMKSIPTDLLIGDPTTYSRLVEAGLAAGSGQ